MGRILDWCMEQSATDLHAQADRRHAYRVDGLLLRIPPKVFPAPTNDDVVAMLREAFSSSTCDRIATILRLAANSLGRAKGRTGDFVRRFKGRLGKAEGIVAGAHT